MLEVSNLSATYGKHSALQGISLRVGLGEIVVILGANGAGKSTLLRAISGICDGEVSGTVSLDSALISELSSDQIVERGIALVPEGRGIFGDLTVKENLLLGAYSNRARRDENANLDPVLKLFPKLQERQGQVVRTMSGGEQQMVAIGRAMMSAPQILMLDEPSLGLSP
jgi:branched-chain amino acid transport system ATP-binding protein